MAKPIVINYVDAQGNEYIKIAENDNYIFLAPFKRLEDGAREIDMTSIRAYSKAEPDYPVERIVSYVKDA